MKIDSNLVRKLIDSQFPEWSSLPISTVSRSGWDNRTFRLGAELSVRMPSAESYASQVHKEKKWLPYLRERLFVSIPEVLASGEPGHGYPWPWSVRRWIDGEDVESDPGIDTFKLAESVAQFLDELHKVDSSVGPSPGSHNYFRGANLAEYDRDTQTYIELLDGNICTKAALSIWNQGLNARWISNPVWVHGDLEASNILVSGGSLAAVIDFGNCAVGDPACDLVMAWTYFDENARENFRSNLNLDNDTWARARAWALWKALFRMSESLEHLDAEFYSAKNLVDKIVSSPF